MNDDFLQDAYDDEACIEYIKNYLPQELKEKFSEDEYYNFIDLISEYFTESGVLDSAADADGYVDIDLDKVVDYIVKESEKSGIGEYDPDEIILVVQGEMEYEESLEEN